MNKLLTRLQQVLSPVFYKTVFGVSFVTYLFIYLVSLGNIAFNGYQLGAHSIQWSNALRQINFLVFESIYKLSMPYFVIRLSPVNITIGSILAVLVGLNIAVAIYAYYNPSHCNFNRSVGVWASLPALVTGGACCAPVFLFIFSFQTAFFFSAITPYLIPFTALILVISLIFMLCKTNIDYNYKQK